MEMANSRKILKGKLRFVIVFYLFRFLGKLLLPEQNMHHENSAGRHEEWTMF